MGIKSLQELQELFARHGVSQLYVKQLAPKQDNEKNQIYLGSGLGSATNLFPAKIVARSPSESSLKPRSSKGRPKVEAQLDLAWVDRSGHLHPAPHARIIDYFQYPEIRLSGFMRGCDNPPDALRRDKQHHYGERILALGVAQDERTIGIVLTSLEDEIVENFPELPELPALPTLQVLTFLGDAGSTPTELLIADLKKIRDNGWHPSVILKPHSTGPIPFKGNQGGGYTLEALLGVPANADKAPDKHGYEIKSYSKSRISLMTLTADLGYEGLHSFRDFMAKFGRPGKAADGRVVFTGVHKCQQTNAITGYTMMVDGYDASSDSFSDDPNDIQVSLKDPNTGEILAAWSFKKLADSWNKKHASAAYVQRERRPHQGDKNHDYDYKFLDEVYICEGTDIWRLLRAIHSGRVYYDSAHTIYSDGVQKVRPQWRINTSRLQNSLKLLYRDVRVVRLV